MYIGSPTIALTEYQIRLGYKFHLRSLQYTCTYTSNYSLSCSVALHSCGVWYYCKGMTGISLVPRLASESHTVEFVMTH